MIKNSVKNYLLPFSICIVVALALYPNSSLNTDLYSTDGLDLNYNIKSDLAMAEGSDLSKQDIFSRNR